MSGRNRGFLLRTFLPRTFLLRTSQVLIFGLCCAGLSARSISAQTLFAPSAQTPATPDSAQPSSAAAKEGDISTPSSTPQHRPLADSTVKLGPGDLVDVGVFGVPDLQTKARISGSGDIYLPLIDYVHVGDLTTDEAQELIQKRLEDGGFVRDPHVTVFVEEAQSQAVTMVGELAHPGPY
ncbi:MAG: polysaccharide biosynthesis/export family protein, partial [Terriglobales bacterium]